MKVFIDTNVLIDVLARRQPFYDDSATLWTLCEMGHVEGLISVISFVNVFYVVRKLRNAATARRTLVILRDVFRPVPCDQHIVNQAIDSELSDFEDAIQYFSALHAGAECLVSRNPKHFPRKGDCPVLTPAEFLATYRFSETEPP